MTSAIQSGTTGWTARDWTSVCAARPRPAAPVTSSDDSLVTAAAAGSPLAFGAPGRAAPAGPAGLPAPSLRGLGAGRRPRPGDLPHRVAAIAAALPEANVGAWLCGIGYRKHLTSRRGERRARAREHDWAEAAWEGGGGSHRRDRLLPSGRPWPDSRWATGLRGPLSGGGFSHAEAARLLDLPPGTVKSHVARGRARLLRALGESDD